MDSDLIKKIFNDYYGKDFDLYGLKFSLFDIQDKNKFIKGYEFNFDKGFKFNFENPNDISHYYPIIEEHLITIVEEFSKYLSIESFRVFVVFRDDQPKFYLNNELINKIQKVFDEINHIQFSVNESYNIKSKYKIYGESTGMKLYWELDNFSINNTFKPTHATLDGEETDISQAISMYNLFLQDNATYWETENIYSKVDSIILESKYPLLVMDGYASYFDTKFVNI